jgi:hypothetical protein
MPERSYQSSSRGFTHGEPIEGIRGHGRITVYESSLATQPAVWVSIAGATDGSATTQLSLEAAKTLRDDLDHLIKNHYQLRGKSDV